MIFLIPPGLATPAAADPKPSEPAGPLAGLDLAGATPAALEAAGCLAQEQNRPDLARALWRASYERDPSRWTAALRLARTSGFRDPLHAAGWFVRAATAARTAFRHQYAFTVNAGLLLAEGFLLAALFTALLWLLGLLPLIHHGLRELIGRFLPSTPAAILAGVALLLPLLANLGFLVTVSLPLILAVWIFKRPHPRAALVI
ncbi:MAG: hypothetical protein GF355_00435, partial [Candidatus Eisenbacteria bacterium]|nr:hypothetical protein [Candidatus Eisenbacteria bacterium]